MPEAAAAAAVASTAAAAKPGVALLAAWRPAVTAARANMAGGGGEEADQGTFQSNDMPDKASSSQFIQPYLIALLSRAAMFFSNWLLCFLSKKQAKRSMLLFALK